MVIKRLLKNCIHFFDAEFLNFPDYVLNWGIDKHVIKIDVNQPIVSCVWSTSGMELVSSNGTTATVIFGSPVTAEIMVVITTIYGEVYKLKRPYMTQITTLTRMQ